MRCRGLPRSTRAAEGAILGALAGGITGAILGGMIFATDKTKQAKAALIIGFGIMGASAVGNAVYEAWLPEC